MPSLPRVLPKIFITTFSNLGREEIIAPMDQLFEAELANCFFKPRDLLVMFFTLVEEIKFRTVPEEELDILISLCSELTTYIRFSLPWILS